MEVREGEGFKGGYDGSGDEGWMDGGVFVGGAGRRWWGQWGEGGEKMGHGGKEEGVTSMQWEKTRRVHKARERMVLG